MTMLFLIFALATANAGAGVHAGPFAAGISDGVHVGPTLKGSAGTDSFGGKCQ